MGLATVQYGQNRIHSHCHYQLPLSPSPSLSLMPSRPVSRSKDPTPVDLIRLSTFSFGWNTCLSLMTRSAYAFIEEANSFRKTNSIPILGHLQSRKLLPGGGGV